MLLKEHKMLKILSRNACKQLDCYDKAAWLSYFMAA